MSDLPASATLRAAGSLRLRAEPGTSFLGDDGPLSYVDVGAVDALVGRHDGDADVRVIDEEGYVSRHHAILDAKGGGWVICDVSTHGTRILVGSFASALIARMPFPVQSGMLVILANTARFTIAVLGPRKPGARTRDAPPPSAAYIRDEKLLRLADALLTLRRRGLTGVPQLGDLIDTLGYSKSSLYEQAKELAGLDPVRRNLASSKSRLEMPVLADALALAYPYLAAPRPKND